MAETSDEILRQQVRKLIQDSETDDLVIHLFKDALVDIAMGAEDPQEIAQAAIMQGEWFRT